MTTVDAGAPPSGGPPAIEDVPRDLRSTRSRADWAFRGLLIACSATLLVVISAIVIYLLNRSLSALRYGGLHFITSELWQPTLARPSYGILGGLIGSLTIAVIALLISMPVSDCDRSHDQRVLAPAHTGNSGSPRRPARRPAQPDLRTVGPRVAHAAHLRHDGVAESVRELHPPAQGAERIFGNSNFDCGIVVAVMILPIITSVTREVMSQVPERAAKPRSPSEEPAGE